MIKPTITQKSYVRPLLSKKGVDKFLEMLSIKKWLSEVLQIDFLNQFNTLDRKYKHLIKIIYRAEKDCDNIYNENTYDVDTHRHPNYKTDQLRITLRNEIMAECINQVRLDNDDDVIKGKGGIRPLGYDTNKDKTIFFIVGSPASGKSTIAKKFADSSKAMMLDTDIIRRKFPEFKTSIKGASLLSKEANEIIKEMLWDLCERGHNIVYQIVGQEYDKLLALTQSVSKYGYEIVIALPELDREIATRRALKRFIETDRYVSLPRIFDEYSNDAIKTFYKMLCYKKDYGYIALNTNVPINQKPTVEYVNKRAQSVLKRYEIML